MQHVRSGLSHQNFAVLVCLDTHECSSYILPSKFTAFPLYKKIIYFTRISYEIRENASFLHHISARIQLRTPLPSHQCDILIHIQSSINSYSLLSFFSNRQSRTGAYFFRSWMVTPFSLRVCR